MPSPNQQYEILNNSLDPVRSITIDGHEVTLNPNGYGVVTDAGLAREIDAQFGYRAREQTGGKVMVVPVDDRNPQYARGYPTYHRITRRMTYRTIAERRRALAQEKAQG